MEGYEGQRPFIQIALDVPALAFAFWLEDPDFDFWIRMVGRRFSRSSGNFGYNRQSILLSDLTSRQPILVGLKSSGLVQVKALDEHLQDGLLVVVKAHKSLYSNWSTSARDLALSLAPDRTLLHHQELQAGLTALASERVN